MTQLHSATTHAPTPPSDPQASGLDADLVAVDAALAVFFAERSAAAGDFGHAYRRLWESARDAAEGGKRLRPRFLLSAFHGLGAPDDRREDAIRTAVAFELLHTAFLLHDDLIDGDTVRRGRPNVAGEFSADALFRGADAPLATVWGESAALLAGDLLLHAASDQLARLDAPAGVRSRLLDALDRAVFVTAAGELADVGLATGMTARGIPDVLAMTEHKTAAYSVSGPLTAGALLAGASDGLLDVLAHYGRLVGAAFQLGDDLLGVFGRPAVTGKSIVSDLREGKETSLIAFARGTAVWPELAVALGRRDLDAVAAVRFASLLQECGARGFVERLLAENVDAAIAAVGSPAVPAALASELTAVARSCVGRIV
ncbi:geranylgeranyl pyrophosphate synthase [Leifsonia xyli subsp. xyli]|uniref:Geranylgeranyl pyrophosphate synthase n=2 Tax=Leifsonia xyli subsp. xyli TaxID=59736 RepID=Q6AE28_LEIXX|nr:polyprenyl synthetase family protein [Leifsonia xyli]AAT89368.1 geranylgeranyl pyrophosphate synthase [Leifsonia xyli subsp. xyli str. CTCB07]ODA89691.1 geranylgeranyl pyrophosphate synthase [Leifsonia xyli subsp. xyli]